MRMESWGGITGKDSGASLLEGLAAVGSLTLLVCTLLWSLEKDGLLLQGWNNSRVSGAVLASG